ncbi:AI-2E family transporter [Dyadobacter fanqingshengii]|uniref:AI-2E family transporter n=1 Tax=Dyadobacter fanqingshengii TaxID=2906443 RepID=A0A9X1P5U4_9BACT|nr:AI-2E family transporter [Dyadobacter fanqingshengii]MCF0038492.1 AI-2E family transporter [Dyadobacter fanqingshengii]USJ34674.1 AI-2E family transporter [Dyadobacter fanqingshengii]
MNSTLRPLPNKDRETALYLKLASILVSLIATVYILYILRETIIPIAFSILLAILLHPVCLWLERHRVPRIGSILLSILSLFIVLVVLVYVVSLQIGSFAEELPRITEKAETILDQTLTMGERYLNISRSQQVSEAKKYLINALSEGRAVLLSTLVTTTGAISTFILIPLYIFFFLLYRDFFRRFFHKAITNVPNEALDVLLKKIYEVIQSYLSGLFLVILIVGVLNSIGLLILGIPHAIFFGFLAGFLILIPYIGILIGSVLPALLAVVTMDSPWYALGVVGVMGFVQFLEGNFITPNIVGSKVSVNPLAAIVALFLGGQLWGLAGLILALPVTAILKVVFDTIPSMEPYGFLLGEPVHEVQEDRKEAETQHPVEKEFKKKPYRRYRNKPRQRPDGTVPSANNPAI